MAGVGSTSLSLGRQAPKVYSRIWGTVACGAILGCLALTGIRFEWWMIIVACAAFVVARRPLRAVGLPVEVSLEPLVLAPITVISGPWIPILLILLVHGLRRSSSAEVRKVNVMVAIACASFSSVTAQTVLLLWGSHEARWIVAALAAFSTGMVINLLALQSYDRAWKNRLRPMPYDAWMGQTGIASAVGVIGVSVSTHWFAVGRPGLGAVFLLCLLPIRPFLKAALRGNRAHQQSVRMMTDMLQWSHPYTEGHVSRVATWAREVGHELGLPPHKVADLSTAAILHDIGKLTVSETVLDQPRKLTPSEFEHIKTHAANGGKLLSQLPGYERITNWIYAHHERPDGRGYPEGLSNDLIPLESKIIAVIDAFDAMTGGDEESEKRNYRQPKTDIEAIAELEKFSGSQFDPKVVEAFKAAWRRG